MSRSLSAMLQEAEGIIEKRASVKAEPVPAHEPEDIFKLAADLRRPAMDSELTMFEKIAHAVALVDTLINADEILKVAAFEEKAARAGFSARQVSEYFEKSASVRFRSVLDMITEAR